MTALAKSRRGEAPDPKGLSLFDRIGLFFADHGLSPTPANYGLVYQFFADATSPQAEAVKAATADGIRLTQRDADRILGEYGMASPPPPAPAAGLDPEVIIAANRQMDAFAAIVESSQADARSYGRDLAEGAAQLEAEGGSAATLIAITRTMIERTKAAERQLSVARSEADSLKAKLAEAGQQARSDALTGLPNRRAFEERYGDLESAGKTVSLAICDVDHFKRVNDTYGHGVGDRVLRAVGEVLNAECGGHFVARLGGEEFVVLFEGLRAEAAAEILDDARAVLSAKQFKVRETDAPLGKVTFSAGIACGSSPSGEVPLARADALLYEAKNGGRNQVRFEAG